MAVKDGVFSVVGSARDIIPTAGPQTKIIDLGGRRVVPGLIDSHTHVIRGGLNYNMELRWDGVPSLADAMAMLKTQAQNTPPPQWVRVVGGFTRHQFVEKRLPTLDEINAAAPETPVFILHLYDRALLNRAALRAVGYTRDTPNPPGGDIQRDASGEPTGMLIAQPNAMILYSTLAKGPKLPEEYQLNSTRHFMRELNRLGVTSVIDAGGGFQNYPDDYEIIEKLHEDGQLTVRLAYNLFTQKPKDELADFKTWGQQVRPGQGDDYYRHNGAGEMLVYSAADFEDFRQPRPDMPPGMEDDLEPVVRQLVEQRWPWRMHATYDETIDRALDVFEKVNRDTPFEGLHWFFDHAETVSQKNIDRIAALGGGVAVQHRMMYQAEDFAERYGVEAMAETPPVSRMMASGVPVGAGTDATRVASYNPWVSLSWLERLSAGAARPHRQHQRQGADQCRDRQRRHAPERRGVCAAEPTRSDIRAHRQRVPGDIDFIGGQRRAASPERAERAGQQSERSTAQQSARLPPLHRLAARLGGRHQGAGSGRQARRPVDHPGAVHRRSPRPSASKDMTGAPVPGRAGRDRAFTPRISAWRPLPFQALIGFTGGDLHRQTRPHINPSISARGRDFRQKSVERQGGQAQDLCGRQRPDLGGIAPSGKAGSRCSRAHSGCGARLSVVPGAV